MNEQLPVEVGQEIETVHGEKLIVLAVKVLPVSRQGVMTGDMMTMVLAESGGTQCWFPMKKIKDKE